MIITGMCLKLLPWKEHMPPAGWTYFGEETAGASHHHIISAAPPPGRNLSDVLPIIMRGGKKSRKNGSTTHLERKDNPHCSCACIYNWTLEKMISPQIDGHNQERKDLVVTSWVKGWEPRRFLRDDPIWTYGVVKRRGIIMFSILLHLWRPDQSM